MADEYQPENLAFRLEKEMARKTGTKLIPADKFDPALHNKVEMPQAYEDDDNYLQVNTPEGYILVWEHVMSTDTISRLAEVIAYNDLTDDNLISYLSEMAMEEKDFAVLDFIIKCYSSGQRVNKSRLGIGHHYTSKNVQIFC